MASKPPNVVLVFADQWRAQAMGYAGHPDVQTPHLNALAADAINCTGAVSGCPVCSPARASLLTGQYPLTHGVIVNDVYLQPSRSSLAQVFGAAGYDTAYIGKWHVDGHGRSNYIPPERQQGFAYWKALECTHDYNASPYYAHGSAEKLYWDGYDAMAQTRDAQQYIASRQDERPFLLVLSWGPPHAPYHTAPEQYRAMYDPAALHLRPNVPASMEHEARETLAGYYAHCTALDDCVGALRRTLRERDLEEDTVFVFFSDHGDMLLSQGMDKKQKPWAESLRVPLVVRYPRGLGSRGRRVDAPIDMPDLMPTVLGLCGLGIPEAVEGLDFSGLLAGGPDPSDGAAVLSCPHPFGQWWVGRGGRAYRGLKTSQYTYVRALEGPWLLYDDLADPYQQHNLIGPGKHAGLLRHLDDWLQQRLDAMGDEFLPSTQYIERFGYRTDERGTVPYTQ